MQLGLIWSYRKVRISQAWPVVKVLSAVEDQAGRGAPRKKACLRDVIFYRYHEPGPRQYLSLY